MDEVFGPAAIAIYTGELDTLDDILRADPALVSRQSSTSHPTLLQLVACDAAQIADPVGAAEILLTKGASPTAPLTAAAGCNSQSIVELFLAHGTPVDGADERWTPLDEAVYWCHHDMAGLLLRHDARVRALSTAAGLGDLSLAEQPGPIGSPFPDTVPSQLATDPTAIVNHAFVMAVNAGQQQSASELLDAGAQINAKPPGFHWHGTALHAAVWRGDGDLVQWLLASGADPSIRDGMVKSDALGWARYHENTHLIPLLETNE